MHPVIGNVTEGSIASEAGILKGDTILEVNGHPVSDVIDFLYHSRDDTIDLKLQRENRVQKIRIRRPERSETGIELKPFRIRSCRNRCVFCFVDQLPKGLRKSLYLKDDDYRMSFLYGNYITLTNLTAHDKKRIFAQNLRPLYVSVHTTNNDLRRKIIGNQKAPDIIGEIRELTVHRIKLHVQIVLCPGLNDGEDLASTIRDLQKFYPYVASIAVVPAGFTKYRRSAVKPVEKNDAVTIIEVVKQVQRRFLKRHGDPFIYLADEFYIKADAPLPSINEYGDLPQIENGVGMVPYFLHSLKKLKVPQKIEPARIAVFTGTAFFPYLESSLKKLKEVDGLSVDAFRVENRFFGSSVTVAGLLSGKDILKTIAGKTRADSLLVPNVVLKNGTDIFLDNITLKDMEESLGMQVRVIDPTPSGLLKGIKDGYKREN